MAKPGVLAVLMDPLADIDYRKDSNLALLFAAQQRGWELLYMEPDDLTAEGGQVRMSARPVCVRMDPKNWFDLGERRPVEAGELDVLLMRKDPPFDMEFIYCTYLLEVLLHQGVQVVNNPRTLRDFNEKAALLHFADVAPEFIISSNMHRLTAFADRPGGAVLKPLDGMGGQSIYRLQPGDTNLPVIIEDLTQRGRRTLMAQQYIPEIADGDKRVFVIDGEPADLMLKRQPADGELRGNLAAGGTPQILPLGVRDREIAHRLAPELKARGVLFAGLDIIGDYLTEVNITCPTGLRQVAEAGLDVAGEIVAALGRRAD